MTSSASQTAGYMGSGASFHRQRFVVNKYPHQIAVTTTIGGGGGVAHDITLKNVLPLGCNPISYNPYTQILHGVGGGGAPRLCQMIPVASYIPPHSPTTLKSEGVRAGEIIAYRSWRVSYDGDGQPVLTGSFKTDAKWPYDKPMEGDAAGGYGVHAYKSMDGAIDDNYYDTRSTDSVFGEVLLWGDIIEHDYGYRAQYGMLHKILLSPLTLRVHGIVDKIKELYARSDRQSSVE